MAIKSTGGKTPGVDTGAQTTLGTASNISAALQDAYAGASGLGVSAYAGPRKPSTFNPLETAIGSYNPIGRGSSHVVVATDGDSLPIPRLVQSVHFGSEQRIHDPSMLNAYVRVPGAEGPVGKLFYKDAGWHFKLSPTYRAAHPDHHIWKREVDNPRVAGSYAIGPEAIGRDGRFIGPGEGSLDLAPGQHRFRLSQYAFEVYIPQHGVITSVPEGLRPSDIPMETAPAWDAHTPTETFVAAWEGRSGTGHEFRSAILNATHNVHSHFTIALTGDATRPFRLSETAEAQGIALRPTSKDTPKPQRTTFKFWGDHLLAAGEYVVTNKKLPLGTLRLLHTHPSDPYFYGSPVYVNNAVMLHGALPMLERDGNSNVHRGAALADIREGRLLAFAEDWKQFAGSGQAVFALEFNIQTGLYTFGNYLDVPAMPSAEAKAEFSRIRVFDTRVGHPAWFHTTEQRELMLANL